MTHPRLLSDKAKLIIALWLLLSAGFLATTLVSYFVSRDLIRESIVETELPLTSDNVYSEIQKDLVRPILISSMMSRDTFLRDWVVGGERNSEKMTNYLKEIMAHYGAFTSFFVSDASRIYYQAAGILKSLKPNEPRDGWYFRVRNMAEPYEINVDPDLANRDKLTIFINYRVFDYANRFIGATGIGLDVDSVIRMIDDYQQRYQRSIYFVDSKGTVVVSGRSGTGNNSKAKNNIRDIDGLANQANAILRAGKGSFEYSDRGHRNFVNVRYVPELKWYLFVVKQESNALSEIQKTLYLNLVLYCAITASILLIVYFTINRYQRRLEQMATTDSLTGLANRYALELLLAQGTREASRQYSALSAIMFDIDHFKTLNDSRGHLAGDRALQRVAATLKENLRISDIACRWGGEEFLVILKDTNLEAATRLADTIRSRIEQQRYTIDSNIIAVTVSAGVAVYRVNESQEDFISRADVLLYKAKEEGRNRVCGEIVDHDVIST